MYIVPPLQNNNTKKIYVYSIYYKGLFTRQMVSKRSPYLSADTEEEKGVDRTVDVGRRKSKFRLGNKVYILQ